MSVLSVAWLAWMFGTVSVYWIAPARWRLLVLVLVTLAFLLVYSPTSAVVLILFSAISYIPTRSSVSGIRAVLVAGTLLGVLVYYKLKVYIATSEDLVGTVGIPLGLSYYTFRCLHYVFERYRETLPPPGFRDYLSYMFFLPTMLVGPINRGPAFFEDIRLRAWSGTDLTVGMERILYGYAKITILSGLLVNRLLEGYLASLPPSQEAWSTYLWVVARGLDLYFLFAGYSDIAIGFGRLMGFRIMENFRWPYLQPNISDFWRAWHISLSSWCRDYVYLPVLGVTRNPYLATLASFVAIGLWHELSFRYLWWGLWHGVGILIWRRFHDLRRRGSIPRAQTPVIRRLAFAASILLTVNYVFLGLVIVHERSLADAGRVYGKIFLGWL